ncbi:MAG: putative aminohydrolase SsnA [Clostridiales bacterium]|jgi:putative selenium metabolism protein SsnA|nr:putative aminohydrolase SsnA [Clostridiales bacterium]MDU6975703.1 putative aminohydrolase SsnA [Clostridiales bacterium]
MLLIGNGYLVSRDEKQPFLQDGCVAIEKDTIMAVGPTDQLKTQYPSATFIDAKKGLIMPGLINTHNHIYSAFARGASLGGPPSRNFLDILEHTWWKLDRHLTLEDTRYSAYWTYLDCIKNGVTTIFDHHASYGEITDSLFAISDVANELGLRTCLCYEVSDRDGQDKMKRAVKENEAFIKASQNHPMQKGLMGLHASFTLSDATLDYCRSHLPKGSGYHIHVAEGIDDVYDSLKKYSKRVLHRLFDQDILGPHTIAGHCIHITPDEMDLLKETDTVVVHNPESNMGNAVGVPPVLELFKRGILIGLGTDGYTNDLFESLKVANILQKHHTCNPAVAWEEIPTMLFEYNPKIVSRFFTKSVGVLKPGYAADVLVADYIPQTPLNTHTLNGHLLFGLNGRCVTTTIANGKVLMKDRQILIADEERLMAKSRQLAQALWNRV